LLYFLQTILAVAASLGVVVFSTPAFILPLVAIALVYWFIGLLYVTTSRELKRMDVSQLYNPYLPFPCITIPSEPSISSNTNKQSTTRSPLFISFSEALVGMSTIRSYGDSARFMRKIFRELDQNTRCFWYLWQTNRVLHNFSNFTGSLVTIFACVFALRNREMSAGAVGFSISYARMSPLLYSCDEERADDSFIH
jgi:ABC-type multidrug transport system fused ATPase/permease subunit